MRWTLDHKLLLKWTKDNLDRSFFVCPLLGNPSLCECMGVSFLLCGFCGVWWKLKLANCVRELLFLWFVVVAIDKYSRKWVDGYNAIRNLRRIWILAFSVWCVVVLVCFWIGGFWLAVRDVWFRFGCFFFFRFVLFNRTHLHSLTN